MKKYFTIGIVIVVLASGGLFARPYIQHHWAIYQLQKMGVNLTVPQFDDKALTRRAEALSFVREACVGNPEVLALLLKTRFDINSQLGNGTTALHCAAAAGLTQQVRLLLDHRANLSVRGGHYVDGNEDLNVTPIHLAAAWHHMDVVRLLKSRGANINESSGAGTPMMIALAVKRQDRVAPLYGRLAKVPDLLRIYQEFESLGADLQAVDEQGNTLLHVAMKSHHRPLIEAMLAGGKFDLNAPNKTGKTPFMNLVSSSEHVDSADWRSGATTDLDLIAQMIEKGAKVSDLNSSGYDVILRSILKPDLFELLVQHGADPFIEQEDRKSIWSELKHAPSVRVISLADKLPQLTTMVKKDGKPGSGPLHVFMSVSRLDLVEYFLKRGVSPDARDGNGSTPLHIVFDPNSTSTSPIYNKIACVRILLDAGADPNARDSWGETPLMRAARVRPVDLPAFIVGMLVAKGADVNAVATLADGRQKHVLDYYSEHQNIDGFSALIKAGAKKTK